MTRPWSKGKNLRVLTDFEGAEVTTKLTVRGEQ
jgi:hypothetical protein